MSLAGAGRFRKSKAGFGWLSHRRCRTTIGEKLELDRTKKAIEV
jgi:hypothetical protein